MSKDPSIGLLPYLPRKKDDGDGQSLPSDTIIKDKVKPPLFNIRFIGPKRQDNVMAPTPCKNLLPNPCGVLTLEKHMRHRFLHSQFPPFCHPYVEVDAPSKFYFASPTSNQEKTLTMVRVLGRVAEIIHRP